MPSDEPRRPRLNEKQGPADHAEATACPRCGTDSRGALECPHCGVVIAKVRSRVQLPESRPSVPPPPPAVRAAEPPPAWRSTALQGIALVAAVWVALRLSAPPDPQRRAAVRVTPRSTVPAAPPLPVELPPGSEVSPEPTLAAPDAAFAPSEEPAPAPDALSTSGGDPLRRTTPNPAGRPSPAATPDANLTSLRQRLAVGDWTGAEDSAIAVLKTMPRLPEALCGLGQALFRQDRPREAVEAAKECAQYSVTATERQVAHNLLRTVEASFATEKGLDEITSEHFNVRFDGEAHSSVSRVVMSSLERQYSTVANALEHRPKGKIPVVLFAGGRYVRTTGSGNSLGAYSSHDGRIRINMDGLEAGITAELEKTLVHEMTHAFAGDLGGSTVPREIHEGLAQYIEGERIGSRVPASVLEGLGGRSMGTWDFYQGALSFVEYLIGLRGMSGMRETLRVMGETHNANRAFDEAFGRSYGELRKAWIAQLRPQ